MIRPVLRLALLVALLAGAELWLARRDARVRSEERRIGTLFTRAEAENLRKQPALRIEGAGAAHRYGRVQGEWRCLSYHQAPADGRALQGLLDAIVSAEGVVHTDSAEEAPAYGINTPRTLRVSIQGPRALQDPRGDVLATLEVGASSSQGSFVRRLGTREVWSLASDLGTPLVSRSDGLPPLLAPSVVPSAWLEESGGLVRIELERGDERWTLAREDAVPAAESPGPAPRPWRWVLGLGGAEPAGEALDVDALDAFATFLERLPYAEVLEPLERANLGLEPPAARLTLAGRSDAPLVLELGALGEAGVALWSARSGVLYRLSSATAERALPSASTLRQARAADHPFGAASPSER